MIPEAGRLVVVTKVAVVADGGLLLPLPTLSFVLT